MKEWVSLLMDSFTPRLFEKLEWTRIRVLRGYTKVRTGSGSDRVDTHAQSFRFFQQGKIL